ncbi:MAG: hypothetical protein R2823_08315 [Acidimicrobiia bacterium]
MDSTPPTERDRIPRLVIAATLASLFAFVFSFLFAVLDINDVLRTGLVSDVNAYRDIGDLILSGEIPYLGFPVEHLPLSLVPVAILTWLAKMTGTSLVVVWVPAMAALFVWSVAIVDRTDPRHRVGYRYLAVAAPLLPLVLFRLEPWVVFLAALGAAAFASGRYRNGAMWTMAGVLAKGWPIVLAAHPWTMGRRRLAAAIIGVSAVALCAVAVTHGFRDARAFDGLHSETMLGSIVLVWRHLTGTDLGIGGAAGAVYVGFPNWTVVINAIPGVILVGIALRAVAGRAADFRDLTIVVGLAVLGIILVSPLFSTQFIFWLTPFVAYASARLRSWYIAAACLGLASVTVFVPTSPVWAFEVLAKNIAIAWLGVLWATELLAATPVQRARTSRRNFPV